MTMTISDFIPYAIGIICCYALTFFIWTILFYKNYKLNNRYALGGVMFMVVWASLAFRNYYFFIAEHRVASNEIMYSNYVTAACALVGSIMFLLMHIDQSNNPPTINNP